MSRAWTPPLSLKLSCALHGLAAVGALSQPSWWPLSLGAVAFNHAALTLAGLVPRSQWLGSNLTQLPKACVARQEVALTFDDGPDPEVTPLVLDLLDAWQVKATFFCIGWRARQHPDICRQMVARGHQIESHGDRHSWGFATWGPARIKADIAAASATLADITGLPAKYFRPIAGLRNPFLEPILCELDLQQVTWTRRGFDTQESQAPVVLQRLQKNLAAGDILLMHDGHSAGASQGAPVILSVLPTLLGTLKRRHLKPVTLNQALENDAEKEAEKDA